MGSVSAAEHIEKAKSEKQPIKCVVWDLDNTLWNGVLLENNRVTPKDGVINVIKEIDRRGILQSIASKNHFDDAKAKLEELNLWEYFLYPEIHWNAKSSSISNIAKSLNIALDTFAFVDDQPFEREEVQNEIPEILCWDALKISNLLEEGRMMPKFITEESGQRRKLYMSDIQRNSAEEAYQGPSESFLETLDMVFEIKVAEEEDLKRAEELTVRTHQLNTTGYTYSYEELDQFRQSDKHSLMVAKLNDKYGTYGTIGLSLVEKYDTYWKINLLLMSCRVMSRGVGSIVMNYIMNQAKQAGVTLRAEFVSNDRNRMMYVTYKFGGFQEIEQNGDLIVFEHTLESIQPVPDYITVTYPNIGMFSVLN